MTEPVYNAVYSSLKRSIIHTSTFSENAMAMRAGLATLDVLESENLGERALVSGAVLRDRLREKLAGFEMVKEVRGLGMLSGIEFQAPRSVRRRVAFEAFRHIHESMFGQVIVMRLFRDYGILTQICGNNFMVLKVAPPLVATEEHLDKFVTAIAGVTEQMHSSPSFWAEPLGLARRVMNI
jgi:ornithine--oxo-acid transaminase